MAGGGGDGHTSWAEDVAGGCVVVAVGFGAVLVGRTYGIGTLRRMEPGFFPVALGVFLCCLGLAMVVVALNRRPRETPAEGGATFRLPDMRGSLCIVLGVLAFLFAGQVAGLAPAAFSCVFLSALGDRTMTWRRALVFALVAAVLGTLLFSVILAVQMPIIVGWPS